MARISIVTHSWAVKKALYSVFLRCQLTSLLHYDPSFVSITICADQRDTLTVSVVDDFFSLLPNMRILWLEDRQMWRRCTGRNIAALEDRDSDLIWFADCDYMFHENCLLSLLSQWEEQGKPEMIFPRVYLANLEKEGMDAFWKANIHARGPLEHPTETFGYHGNRRAIGGLQIVSGEYARKNGYLNRSKWMRPPDVPFPDTRDDVAFRERLKRRGGRYISIPEIPGLCRLRHTEVGYGLVNDVTPSEVPL